MAGERRDWSADLGTHGESKSQVWSHSGLRDNRLSGTPFLGTALYPKLMVMVGGIMTALWGHGWAKSSYLSQDIVLVVIHFLASANWSISRHMTHAKPFSVLVPES